MITIKNKKEIFKEIEQHLLKDEKPSIYLNKKLESGIFHKIYPFTFLSNLVEIPQSPEHHPEGNVWKHTMLVVDEAAKKQNLSKDPRVFMWSALLHDLGKAPTTKIRKGKITAYNHDKIGKDLAVKFLKEFSDEDDFVKKVAQMVRWHMQSLFINKNLPFADIETMLSEVSIHEISLLSLCDRLGRAHMTEQHKNDETAMIEGFVKISQEFLSSQ